MLRKSNIYKRTFLFVMMLFALSCVPALADNGDGSGGGQGNPLALVSSSPANGQKDVSLSPEINLTFTKNVVNMSVKDNNEKCFELYDGSQKKVPAKVILADDQIEPEKKRIIVISPNDKLKPGSSYTLKILPGLQSKSGVTLGKAQEIRFTTAGVQVSKDTNNNTSQIVNNIQPPDKSADAPTQTPKATPNVSPKQNELPGKEQSGSQADLQADSQSDSQTDTENESASQPSSVSPVTTQDNEPEQTKDLSSAASSEENKGDNEPAAIEVKEKKNGSFSWSSPAFLLVMLVAAALAVYIYIKTKKR